MLTPWASRDSLSQFKHSTQEAFMATVQDVVNHFAGVGESLFNTDKPYIYAEVGKYKPFHGATITALRKRGYRVKPCFYYTENFERRLIQDVYYIYDKEESA
jgi:hypothetical protein